MLRVHRRGFYFFIEKDFLLIILISFTFIDLTGKFDVCFATVLTFSFPFPLE